MKISILLLSTLAVFFDGVCGSSDIPEELRNEFHDLASSRLDHILKHVTLTDLSLTMSFIVTDCQVSLPPPKIGTAEGQMTLEEATCGTVSMHEWCDEKPGRVGILMTSNKKINRAAIARFVCDIDGPGSIAHDSERTIVESLTNIGMVFMIIGVLASWRIKCTRPVPVHPSNILSFTHKSDPSDSFENITLNSSTKSARKSLSSNSLRSFFIAPKKFRIIV